MSFESFAHVPVTEELLHHVWEGEVDTSQGGHRYGRGREGKTEFPQHWDLSMLRFAVGQVLEAPHTVRYRGPHIYLLRKVGELIVAVDLLSIAHSIRIRTAYPVNGEGVARNTGGLRVELPLDISVLEA
jgi:hypothetical protein